MHMPSRHRLRSLAPEAAFPKQAAWAGPQWPQVRPGWQMQLHTATHPCSLHRFPWPETPAREKYYRLHSCTGASHSHMRPRQQQNKQSAWSAHMPVQSRGSTCRLALLQCPVESWRARLWQYSLAEQGVPDAAALGARLQACFSQHRLGCFRLQPGVRVWALLRVFIYTQEALNSEQWACA